MVLLQWLREVLVHLGLYALFAIAHHGVCRKGDDGRPLRAETPFVLANFACGFKATL